MYTGTYSPTVAVMGNSSLTTDNPFYGKIYEVIVLTQNTNSVMDPTNLNKVQSYLAIKYGISLDTVNQANYLISDGLTEIWTGGNNTGYRKDIFGIGRDDASGLYQKQGKSAVENMGPTVFVGDLTTLNSQNTGTLSDKHFLVIGSNGRSDLVQITIAHDSAYLNGNINATNGLNLQSGAIYKAQLTDMTSINVNLMTPTNDFRYVFVSNSDQFDPNYTYIYPIITVNARKVAQSVTIDNTYKYFTFVGAESGPGGVFAGLKLWLHADDEASLTILPFASTEATLGSFDFVKLPC